MSKIAMSSLTANEYVEIRDGRHYYVAGTRIGLDVFVHDFRSGKTPEAILQAYPSIGSLGNVYGAIAFILEHPKAVESYLREQDALWNRLREEHPLPDEMRYRATSAQSPVTSSHLLPAARRPVSF